MKTLFLSLLTCLITTLNLSAQALPIASVATKSMYAVSDWTAEPTTHTDRSPRSALPEAERQQQLHPDRASIYRTLGHLYLEEGQMEQAKAAFEHYLTLAPTDPTAHEGLAYYYRAAGQYGLAADYFHHAAALGINDSSRRQSRGHHPRRH